MMLTGIQEFLTSTGISLDKVPSTPYSPIKNRAFEKLEELELITRKFCKGKHSM